MSAEQPTLMEKIKALGPTKIALIAVLAVGGIAISNFVADWLAANDGIEATN